MLVFLVISDDDDLADLFGESPVKSRPTVCKGNVISELTKGTFIVCYNTAVLPMYWLLMYHSSMQQTALQVHFLAVPQCSSLCRDGNTTTAI